MRPKFNAAETSLDGGFTVIEASAGTGKTTTISAIILRLLAEQGIPIEQILVTTYTELATAELRGRIRDTITDALAQKRLPFVAEIVKRVTDRKQFERRLKIALQSFDEAPIFTIHGFCARVLADRAFESGVPFEAELVADQSRFLNEIADDFWRAHFYTDDTVMAALLRERLTPARRAAESADKQSNPARLSCSRKSGRSGEENYRTMSRGRRQRGSHRIGATSYRLAPSGILRMGARGIAPAKDGSARPIV